MISSPDCRGRITPMKQQLIALSMILFLVSLAPAQIAQDQQAEMLLNSAQKAYNERNFAFAQGKFREFLQKFGSHKDAAAARYGLALTLIDGPEKKYDEARDLLQNLAADKNFADRTLAVYHAGVANRALGLQSLALANAAPNDAAKHRANAQARFQDASPQFAEALIAFTAKVEKPIQDDKLTHEAEWVARARCDLAEVQLRAGKLKDSLANSASFVADPVWSKSRYANLGRYYHGYASVLLKDYVAAQKTLSLLAPFSDPDFGVHARYLLARTHHVENERAEALANYEGTIADFAKARANAVELLKQPQKFNNDPEVRARLESLLKNPPPDHVARATFYLGVLQYEGGKFSEAKSRFQEFIKQFPQSALRTEADLRVGYCQVQLKEYADALKTLTPLVEKDALLSDQVLFWIGKAQVGAAPDAAVNAQGHNQAILAALNTFRQAAERAQKIVQQDADARTRRGEILLEMADQMQRIWQNKEASVIYAQIMNEKALPEREEEIMQRVATALQLAGDHDASDKACIAFLQRFGQSTLVAAVLFTYAENSFFRMTALEKNPNPGEREKFLQASFEETVKRHLALISKYPEFAKINVARYSLGLTYYRRGDLKNTLKTLADIPGPDRTGDLAQTPLVIADCLLRQTPTTVPEDALAAGKMEDQLKAAAEALESFIAGNTKDPNLADALLKFGLTQQRLAGLAAQPKDRVAMYNAARATYEKLMRKDFGVFPVQMAHATFERAKCISNAGDMNTGINELRKFTADPMRQTPVAPQAILQLTAYLRAQNKAPEAADVLAKNRDFLEAMLTKDQEKGPMLTALLRYHHGVSLRESGKLPEARALFESVIKLGQQRPEATEAALRIGQCLKDEGQQRLDAARKLRPSAKKPEEIAVVQKIADEGYKLMRDSVAFLETQSDQIKASPALQEVRGRMLYDAAWGCRILAEPELESARTTAQQEMLKKLNASSSKFPLPEVTIEKLPLQPSEKRARGLYKLLIDQVGDINLATEARFEFAELLADRNEHDAAMGMLNDVLDKEPSPEMTEKIRLRMGSIHAAKGNLKAALQQFDAVASNPKSALIGWAQYRAGEALIGDKQYPDAIKRLVIFRDQPAWNNVNGLTDRALARLGFAFGNLKSWDESRVAYERVVNQFPNSPWHDEARYGIGWALQQQKNFDGAANSYAVVVSRTATDLAAKAQLQIGLCRMEQKRYQDAANAFLVVPTTYDYPELRAAALLEAGKAFLELKQVPQANMQFERILREFPGTMWAEAAKEKLGQK